MAWMTSVREKLSDPALAHWFLRFATTPPIANQSYWQPPCDNTDVTPVCSQLYHAQTQAPGTHPRPATMATAARVAVTAGVPFRVVLICGITEFPRSASSSHRHTF